jgi:hypothetical protein
MNFALIYFFEIWSLCDGEGVMYGLMESDGAYFSKR